MLKSTTLFLPLLAVCFFQPSLFANEPVQEPEKSSSGNAGFSIVEDEHGVAIKIDGQPFAIYVIDEVNKPYLWPVFGPTGKPMTRAFPMQDLPSEGQQQRDHVHHRGITFGHESIAANAGGGGDTWHERRTFAEPGKNPKAGSDAQKRMAMLSTIQHREFTELVADAEHAVIAEICDYLDPAGKRYLTEERRITFRVQPNSRSIDFDQVFMASDGEVRFDDRKDAGLSIRVPVDMALDSKKNGHIVNSEGDVDNDAWSKAAKWCDYNGPVDGEHLGIAMLNHPSSYRFPTRWHVRGYGLFTANPFASQSFDGSLPGLTTNLKSAEQLKLHHRFIFYSGDAAAAEIEEAWQQYSEETK